MNKKKLTKADFEEIKDFIVHTLDQNKALDILEVDLEGKSNLADYMIIASGTSTRHVHSLGKIVDEETRKKFKTDLYLEGFNNAEWLLLDFYGVIVHLFQPEVRAKYNLEKLYNVNRDHHINEN